MAASRVGSCGAYLPSKPPLGQVRTDGWSFDLAVPEFARRPAALAEASPRAVPARGANACAARGNGRGRPGGTPVRGVQAEGNHKTFGRAPYLSAFQEGNPTRNYEMEH